MSILTGVRDMRKKLDLRGFMNFNVTKTLYGSGIKRRGCEPHCDTLAATSGFTASAVSLQRSRLRRSVFAPSASIRCGTLDVQQSE